MKSTLIAAALLVAFASIAAAQTTPSPAPAPGAPTTVGPNYVDANGDGICDRFQSGQTGQGKRYGNGTGTRPQDGTGMGPGPSAGGGTCDGTGPKGQGARRGRR